VFNSTDCVSCTPPRSLLHFVANRNVTVVAMRSSAGHVACAATTRLVPVPHFRYEGEIFDSADVAIAGSDGDSLTYF
jgi:hypothetical protein